MVIKINSQKKIILIYFHDKDECNQYKYNLYSQEFTQKINKFKKDGFCIINVISGKKDLCEIIKFMIESEAKRLSQIGVYQKNDMSIHS